MERKSLSKKLRFEVFKRDSFTCQYCGKSAPSIILEVDHIAPVSKGGEDNILNLITSCVDCNRGKSNREISDDSVMAKRKAQLDELQLRREQIEMMMEWQLGLEDLKTMEFENLIKIIDSKINPFSLNEFGISTVRSAFSKYSYQEIFDCIQISAAQYLEFDQGSKPTQESISKMLDYIPKIAKTRRLFEKKPYLQDLFRLKSYMKSKGFYIGYDTVDILENAYQRGIEIDSLEAIIRQSRNWSEWNSKMAEVING